jgi:two-component system chemotaxis response regulator CheY
MLIDVINHNTAQEFLAWLKTAAGNQSAVSILYFRFATTGRVPGEESMLEAIVPVLAGRKASVFVFKDGDAIIVWGGTQKAVLAQVSNALYRYFNFAPELQLHHYYDLHAHGEELRAICHQKMEGAVEELMANNAAAVAPSHRQSQEPTITLGPPTARQLMKFTRLAAQRKTRWKPEILVVEDQTFSRKLLQNMLDKIYTTYAAADAVSAYELHLQHAPDVLLLDIELPDVNGHALAKAIREFDANAFIVMVTANHYLEDVNQARENGAKGFIVKPYSIQKVLDAIHSYTPHGK